MHVIAAPSNLGLRPLWSGHEPGAWRSPSALFDAGLLETLGDPPLRALERPRYSALPQEGTRILNGATMRRFNLDLAEAVREAAASGEFALVIGGDCSILSGALLGARAGGPIRLLHLDGHSDFRHPGNYDFESAPGAAAGMDLALVTGRGETIGADWPGLDGPLVHDHDVIQVGERESRDADYAWPDIADTEIERIDIFEVDDLGIAEVAGRVGKFLRRPPATTFWVHFDVDVLDQSVMAAVDSPGSPGMLPHDVSAMLSPLVADPMCLGMTVTVFDPDKDRDGTAAALLVSMIGALPIRDGAKAVR